ncbi:uncharacterized protein BDZ99DRAFT_466345 [Mytilinidion resinicola]|uniref:DUF6594 domain-containing protein n=1 Tax=Mytilinidion resinicola TaxID=574789 RepID=A0A6A6YDI1_9PEZI|nr:uncharacterized protein BDZ99DRAFT_466345 [Mytilinidion resinicola]KAF2806054.1 hypothetical protein BDZ99DRAFT_466345 [Mytilinidion resinicola]
MLLPRYGKLSTEIIYEIQHDLEEKCQEFEEARYQLEECRRRAVHVSGNANPIQPTEREVKDIETKFARLKTERRDLWFMYNKALSSYAKTAALPDPIRFSHNDFHKEMERCDPDAKLHPVFGCYGSSIDRDLCTIKEYPPMDPFSNLIIFHVLIRLGESKRFERFFEDKSTQKLGVVAGVVTTATHVINSVLLPLFLAGSIIGLFFVKSMIARLAVIVALLLVFSFVAIFFVRSGRNDMVIFMSAYAAVLVVFVSGNMSSQ